MSEIISWSATTTRQQIAQKSVSCLEVAEAHLAHVKKTNPALNALTQIAEEEALATARALDGQADDKSHLLRGVPLTTKINVDQAGFANSNGIPAFQDKVADDDAAFVKNLKADGAVILGRTNTPEFSMRWCTSNPLHGISLNPWDETLTPGGSSGAAAAAAASYMGCIAHGNDLGGSLRYPAYCCGVATIKPSTGRVPAFNPSAPTARPPLTQTMSVQGPIARTIADVRLGLQSMAKRSCHDPLWVNAPASGRQRDGTITIGFSKHPFAVSVEDDEVSKAMDIAIAGLKDAGYRVIETPFIGADEAAQLWGDMLFTETSIFMGDMIDNHGSDDMKQLVENYKAYYEMMDLGGFMRGMHERLIYQRQVNEMFDEIDLYLMPTSLIRPFENDFDFKYPNELPMILDAQKPLHLVNMLSLPSVALPTHLADKTPLGVQLIAPLHDDYFALDVAQDLETEIGTLLS